MPETDAFYAALDDGLAALTAGTPLDQVTRELSARYPAYAAELPELLAAAHTAGAGAPPAPPPTWAQARSRAAFLGRAAALRQPARRRAWAIFSLPLARVALTALVFVGGFAAGTYGAVAASADALPGEALYAVKRAAENTELLLTDDPQSRTALEAEFTKRRVAEVQQLTDAGRLAAVEFTGWLSALNGEHWIVAGLPVSVPAGTPITGAPRPGVWVRVKGQVQPDRTVRAERVAVVSDDDVPLPTPTELGQAATAGETDTAQPTATPTEQDQTPSATPTAEANATRTATHAATQTPAPTPTVLGQAGTPQPSATLAVAVGEDVEFTGVVESIGAGAWQIGGQAVAVNAATEIRDNPQVGQTVEVRALRQADGTLLATRIRAEESGGTSATNTPGGGGSGPSASNTPEATDDDGGGSGPSPSNTPEPTDDGGGGSGPSPSNTPKPDDDSGGGGGGPSATNTPKPDDD